MEIYNLNSTELINQILADRDCSCLLEPHHQTLLEFKAGNTPSRDNKKDLLEALELTSNSIFNKQNKLTLEFRLDELNLNTKMRLLKRVDFDSILKNNEIELGREILRSKCPSGMLSLSPPLFNETYNIAVISVSGCSSGGSMDIYKLNNGKWLLTKFIYVHT